MNSKDTIPTSKTSRGRRLAINLALLLATLVLLLGIFEVTLRLTGFSFVLYPEEIEFGMPDPVVLETGFRPDRDLFWVTPDYAEKLERLRREPPAIVFMGDSCTQFGRYPEMLVELLAERRGLEVEGGNLGVAGWSSHQGRRQLERDVLSLEPEVVTIYYGWNDHWIGFGIEDKNVARVGAISSSRWGRFRLAQLVSKAILAWATRETAWPNRVSLEDFRANLRTMAEAAVEEGVRPVLITAALSHVEGEEPAYLTERWLRERSELVPLHRSYVEAVREIAGDVRGAVLCDAAAELGELPREELETLFLADGIHLTPAGDRRLAELLFSCFEDAGLLAELRG